MRQAILAGALGLAAIATPAQAQSPKWAPEAGTLPYRYVAVQKMPDRSEQGFRMDYDLVSDGKGGLIAVVLRAEHGKPDAWVEAEVDEACRTSLHARPGELARITLAPVAPAVAASMGEAFMAACAPQDIFSPMTDILNVAQVQLAPHFGLARLARAGDTRRFPAFAVKIERFDTAASIAAPGGSTTLSALAPDRATIDWVPDPMTVDILMRGAMSGADVSLKGTQNFAFRILIDPRTGALLGATAPAGKLDLTMTLPGGFSQPLPVVREVVIAPRR